MRTPKTPMAPAPDAMRVERIGSELFMRDEAGNLIKLHVTPLTTSTSFRTPTAKPELTPQVTSPSPKAADGMDIDGDSVSEEVIPAKANTRKTRPIHRGSSTAATSSTQDRSMDFRSPDVAGASRKGRRKRDEDERLHGNRRIAYYQHYSSTTQELYSLT